MAPGDLPRLRTIRESHVATHIIDAEIRRDQRLEDLYVGLTWRLAREPQVGYPIPRTDPQAYVIHSYHWPVLSKIAPIVVAYTFDDDVVVIWALRVLH